MKRSAVYEDSIPANGKAPIRLLLHAVDGVVPYMTPLLLKHHFQPEKVAETMILGMAIRDTCVAPVYPNPNDNTSAAKKKKVDATKPCGYTFKPTAIDNFLSGYNTVVVPSFDLYLDATENHTGSSVTVTNKHVMMWTPHGRQSIKPDVHAEAARGLEASSKCLATIPLYDMALDKDTGKRKFTSFQRSLSWLVQHSQSQPNEEKGTNLWAPILLYNDEQEANDDPHNTMDGRLKVIGETMDKHSSITGIAIAGWPHILDRPEANTRLQKVIKAYSQQKMHSVSVLATSSLTQVLDAIKSGVNVIGSALPTQWAKSKRALAWTNLEEWDLTEKKRKTQQEDSKATLDKDGCIDLHEVTFARDARPLIPGCSCLACQDTKHSRAYIHHLVQAKELLAEILLFGHNLHQMLLLCQNATKALHQDKVHEFCSYVEAQLNQNKVSTE